MIDCDQLLYGQCSIDDVRTFFKQGSFNEEKDLIVAIQRYLITPSQQGMLQSYTISDILNGRAAGVDTNSIFDEWNRILGFRWFGV